MNMDQMRIATTVFKVSDFLSWQRGETLTLSPSFQRRAVWSSTMKSYLIDTVVRGLPMPAIIIREVLDPSTGSVEAIREVVDGQQRLRTLFSFIRPSLLQDYNKDKDYFRVKKTHNSVIASKLFTELPEDIQRRLLSYEFSVQVLPIGTDDRTVLQIFARLNSTGLRANSQELRNASFFGEFKSCMYELAYEQLTRWRGWGIFNETSIARMDEVETTSELVLLMFDGVEGKSQRRTDEKYAALDDDFPTKGVITDRFQNVMNTIDDTLSPDLRTMAFSRRALFYVLFAFFYDEMYGLGSKLENVRPKVVKKAVNVGVQKASDMLRNPEELPGYVASAIRGATTDIGSRNNLFKFLKDTVTNAVRKP